MAKIRNLVISLFSIIPILSCSPDVLKSINNDIKKLELNKSASPSVQITYPENKPSQSSIIFNSPSPTNTIENKPKPSSLVESKKAYFSDISGIWEVKNNVENFYLAICQKESNIIMKKSYFSDDNYYSWKIYDPPLESLSDIYNGINIDGNVELIKGSTNKETFNLSFSGEDIIDGTYKKSYDSLNSETITKGYTGKRIFSDFKVNSYSSCSGMDKYFNSIRETPIIIATETPLVTLPACPTINIQNNISNSLYSVEPEPTPRVGIDCIEVGNVSGKIIDETTGLGISNINLNILDKATKTDSLGKFELNNINIGEQNAIFEKSGYEPIQKKIIINKNETTSLNLNITFIKIESTEYSSSGNCWVNGYYRRNGTYVSGYYRSCQNSYSIPSSNSGSSGSCWVNGYRRSNGTYVSGYWRSCR